MGSTVIRKPLNVSALRTGVSPTTASSAGVGLASMFFICFILWNTAEEAVADFQLASQARFSWRSHHTAVLSGILLHCPLQEVLNPAEEKPFPALPLSPCKGAALYAQETTPTKLKSSVPPLASGTGCPSAN